MFEDALLTPKQIANIHVGVQSKHHRPVIGDLWKGDSELFHVIAKAQHLATLKAVVERLDEQNSLVKHTSPNFPDYCGLLITLERWQEIRQALKKSMEE